MGDPTRLLSTSSDADALERALLESLHVPDPEQAAQAEMWRGIATNLVAATLVGAAPLAASSAAAASALPVSSGVGAKLASTLATLTAKSLVTKLALVAIAVGSVGVGGAVAWRQRHAVEAPAERAPAVLVVPRQVAAPVKAHEEPAILAPVQAPGEPATEVVSETSKHAPRDALLSESKLLGAARADLLRGALAGAQRTLGRLASKHPRGVLLQEREVLTIEVLSARGKVTAARRHARAFVAANPTSPHTVMLRRFLDAP